MGILTLLDSGYPKERGLKTSRVTKNLVVHQLRDDGSLPKKLPSLAVAPATPIGAVRGYCSFSTCALQAEKLTLPVCRLVACRRIVGGDGLRLGHGGRGALPKEFLPASLPELPKQSLAGAVSVEPPRPVVVVLEDDAAAGVGAERLHRGRVEVVERVHFLLRQVIGWLADASADDADDPVESLREELLKYAAGEGRALLGLPGADLDPRVEHDDAARCHRDLGGDPPGPIGPDPALGSPLQGVEPRLVSLAADDDLRCGEAAPENRPEPRLRPAQDPLLGNLHREIGGDVDGGDGAHGCLLRQSNAPGPVPDDSRNSFARALA